MTADAARRRYQVGRARSLVRLPLVLALLGIVVRNGTPLVVLPGFAVVVAAAVGLTYRFVDRQARRVVPAEYDHAFFGRLATEQFTAQREEIANVWVGIDERGAGFFPRRTSDARRTPIELRCACLVVRDIGRVNLRNTVIAVGCDGAETFVELAGRRRALAVVSQLAGE